MGDLRLIKEDMNSIIKKSSAWVPIVLSLGMLAFILILLVGVYGVPAPNPNADEGVAAHPFQYFVLKERGG